jgi:hypothetical protein
MMRAGCKSSHPRLLEGQGEGSFLTHTLRKGQAELNGRHFQLAFAF